MKNIKRGFLPAYLSKKVVKNSNAARNIFNSQAIGMCGKNTLKVFDAQVRQLIHLVGSNQIELQSERIDVHFLNAALIS